MTSTMWIRSTCSRVRTRFGIRPHRVATPRWAFQSVCTEPCVTPAGQPLTAEQPNPGAGVPASSSFQSGSADARSRPPAGEVDPDRTTSSWLPCQTVWRRMARLSRNLAGAATCGARGWQSRSKTPCGPRPSFHKSNPQPSNRTDHQPSRAGSVPQALDAQRILQS